MRFLILFLVCAVAIYQSSAAESEQRILRRVIKSTPTATNLGRIRLVHVRSLPSGAQEKGAVTEISGKEAATFGMRNSNETTTSTTSTSSQQQATKSTQSTTSAPPTPSTTTTSKPKQATPSTTTTTTSTTTTTTAAPQTSSSAPVAAGGLKPASERQVIAQPEVELLVHAPSWQTMTAVEAPAAMLIAAGTRRSSSSANDLSSSASIRHYTTAQLIADESSAADINADVLRSSASSVKGGQIRQSAFSTGETFSRLRQQHSSSKTNTQQQQQQSFYYPPPAPARQQLRAVSKTSQVQATKTNWYQPPSTTPRPAPLIEQQQQYEQQSENYVEQQQQQVEYSAPPGEAEPFAFDFKTQDQKGNGQYRKEESDKNGSVKGSYGYTDANGIYRHVEYVADQNGFRAKISSNEPGMNGETDPANIQLARGAEGASSNRLVAAAQPAAAAANDDWSSSSSSNDQASPAELAAIANSDFESSHKPESIRSRRHFRN